MLHYYGTALRERGHYLWQVDDNVLRSTRLDHFKLPFNVESLPYIDSITMPPNGEARFYQFAGFSILAIQGSCIDFRPGSKSIFFRFGTVSLSELKESILLTPASRNLIEAMPFRVNWPTP